MNVHTMQGMMQELFSSFLGSAANVEVDPCLSAGVFLSPGGSFGPARDMAGGNGVMRWAFIVARSESAHDMRRGTYTYMFCICCLSLSRDSREIGGIHRVYLYTPRIITVYCEYYYIYILIMHKGLDSRFFSANNISAQVLTAIWCAASPAQRTKRRRKSASKLPYGVPVVLAADNPVSTYIEVLNPETGTIYDEC
jgi:hypothetical protein